MTFRRLDYLCLGAFSIWIIGSRTLKPYLDAFTSKKSPQLVLVLGGDVDREHVGVGLAKALKLPLVVSGGSNPEHALWLFEKAGISSEQASLDYRAKDTLGNFTSLVDVKKNIEGKLSSANFEDMYSDATLIINTSSNNANVEFMFEDLFKLFNE